MSEIIKDKNTCKVTYIYGLYEVGKENEIRYIGKSDNPKQRLSSHIYDSKKGTRTHKKDWIRKVINNGNKIGYKIIEEVNYENWSQREIYWISKIKNLTNTSPGGETGITGKTFEISYIECKNWIRYNLPQIKSKKEWNYYIKYNKIPDNIPRSPHTVFKKCGWVSWSEFLNNGFMSSKFISEKYLTYNECKEWLKDNLDIENFISWNKTCKNLPEFIPKKPNEHFKNKGWVNWTDFIGFELLNTYLSYNDAKLFISKYNLKSSREMRIFLIDNNITNLPKSPQSVYKKEWKSVSDYLACKPNGKNNEYIKYDELLNFIKKELNFIKTQRQWILYFKTNYIKYIPKCPQHVYKNKGWVSWNVLLDTKKYIKLK